ncbi:hypothetical protein BDY24DRAFT_440348 [Mrakia frigida]|uniref:Zn(II)2Cys6 transcription factor domain-containing protein n=1 Tax=Mrakia frigida TaxID=29902 RepID=UPI003FCBEF9D
MLGSLGTLWSLLGLLSPPHGLTGSLPAATLGFLQAGGSTGGARDSEPELPSSGEKCGAAEVSETVDVSPPLSPPKLASIHTILHRTSSSPRPSTSAILPRSSHPYERRDSSNSSNTAPPSPTRPSTSSASNGTTNNAGRVAISRTTRACDNCRARKTRCLESEGGEGTCCGRCRDMGLDCAWSGGGKKRGPVAGSMRPNSSHTNARRASTTPTSGTFPSEVFPNFKESLSLQRASSSSSSSSHHPHYSQPPPSVLASSRNWSISGPPHFSNETPSVFAPSSSTTPHGQWSRNEPSPGYTPSSFLERSPSSNSDVAGWEGSKRDRAWDQQGEEGMESFRLPSLNVAFGGGGERGRSGVRLY